MSEPMNGEIEALHYKTGKPVRVTWNGGVVSKVEELRRANVDAIWIAPPLFDVQVNGYGGVDFQRDDFTGEDLLTAARKLREHGCAKFFLTLITADWAKLIAR